jgi:hypothetical protein
VPEVVVSLFVFVIELLVFVLQRVTDLLVEIIGLVEYATSASYRAGIDKQYEGHNRWLKWYTLSENSIRVAFVVAVAVTLFLLRPSHTIDEAHNGHHPVQEIEQSIMNRLHKAHPQD